LLGWAVILLKYRELIVLSIVVLVDLRGDVAAVYPHRGALHTINISVSAEAFDLMISSLVFKKRVCFRLLMFSGFVGTASRRCTGTEPCRDGRESCLKAALRVDCILVSFFLHFSFNDLLSVNIEAF
jgi:hypothetical protein